jgi:hypothetical protein
MGIIIGFLHEAKKVHQGGTTRGNGEWKLRGSIICSSNSNLPEIRTNHLRLEPEIVH